MANWQTYNFPDAVAGDNYSDKLFEIKLNNVAADLTGAAIKMRLFNGYYDPVELTTVNSKIVITDAVAGKFKVVFGKISMQPAIYKYDIEITFADGTVKTWIKGNLKILADITK